MTPPRTNLARIIAVLGVFDDINTPLATHALLARVGIARSTGFGLLRAMVASGWLERVDHGLLRLGPRAADLAWLPLEEQDPAQSARCAAIPAGAPPAPPRPDPMLEWDPALVATVDTRCFACPPPWRIGFANASHANPWRRAMRASIDYAHRLHQDRIGALTVTDAGDDAALQMAQIDTLVAAGLDLLIVSTSSVTEARLSAHLNDLATTGLPIVAVDRRPNDPAALTAFVTASDRRIGRMSALWLAEHLKGRGRIWMLSGLEGTSPALRRQSAALAEFAHFPELRVETVANTDWTEAGGYGAVSRILSQIAEPPDGLWCDSGLQGLGALRRCIDQGGALPAMTGGDLNGMYKLCLRHKVPFAALDYPAAMGARALEVALDILDGRPVQRRVEVPVRIVLPRGRETSSVKADLWAETHVGWDLPDDAVLSQGPSLMPAFPSGGRSVETAHSHG